MNEDATAEKKPLLFISHKHADKPIAQVIKDFVVKGTANKVRVFLSSDPDSEGPAIGQSLADELQKGLWEADAVILVYTAAAYDWSYCMWECGVATDPKDPNTNIYVLQCGLDVPQPFSDKVRIRAKKLDDIEKFTRLVLTDPDFFPGHEKITDYGPETQVISDLAKELFDELTEALPEDEPNEWAAWPSLQLELKREVLDSVHETPKEKKTEAARKAVAKSAVVTKAGSRIAGLFGMEDLALPMPLQELVKAWEAGHPGRRSSWLDTVCDQLLAGSKRMTPQVKWELLTEVSGDKRYLPGVSRVRYLPSEDILQFGLYFYWSSEAIPIGSIMTKLSKARHEKLNDKTAADINLKELLEELDKNNWRRLPIVTAEDHPLYIVHLSMIDDFIRRQAFSGQDLDSLTLEDLMADPGVKDIFETTFVTVPEDTSLQEARRTMEGVNRCQDIFVTETGGKDEPVLGWVTDRDITEA